MSSYTCIEVGDQDRQFNALLEESPDTSIFVQQWYLEAISQPVRRWLLMDQDRPAIGVLLPTDPDGRGLAHPATFSMYQGVLRGRSWSTSAGDSLTQAPGYSCLLRTVLEQAGNAVLETSPYFTDVRQILWFNHGESPASLFQTEVRYSGRIDLDFVRRGSEYLSSMPKGRRSDLKRAIGSLTVAITPSAETLEQLHALTFARQDVPRDDDVRGKILGLARACERDDRGFTVLVCDQGRPVSATLFVVHEGTAYYLISGTDPEYRTTGAGTLAVVTGIQEAAKRGMKCVDVVGMNSPNRSRFKSSLGAHSFPYYRFSKIAARPNSNQKMR